jgi:hypothetical protein
MCRHTGLHIRYIAVSLGLWIKEQVHLCQHRLLSTPASVLASFYPGIVTLTCQLKNLLRANVAPEGLPASLCKDPGRRPYTPGHSEDSPQAENAIPGSCIAINHLQVSLWVFLSHHLPQPISYITLSGQMSQYMLMQLYKVTKIEARVTGKLVTNISKHELLVS